MTRNDGGPLLPQAGENDPEAVVRWLLRRADLLRQLLSLGQREQPGFAEARTD